MYIGTYTNLYHKALVALTYSVTQSSSNSLLGDVVLDSFNKVYRDEDSILDQTYRTQICSAFYYDDF